MEYCYSAAHFLMAAQAVSQVLYANLMAAICNEIEVSAAALDSMYVCRCYLIPIPCPQGCVSGPAGNYLLGPRVERALHNYTSSEEEAIKVLNCQ